MIEHTHFHMSETADGGRFLILSLAFEPSGQDGVVLENLSQTPLEDLDPQRWQAVQAGCAAAIADARVALLAVGFIDTASPPELFHATARRCIDNGLADPARKVTFSGERDLYEHWAARNRKWLEDHGVELW
jgi:hypothetical protein